MPDDKAICDYLGDGVYAQFMPPQDALSSGQLWLMTQRCNNPLDAKPDVRIERVCLEPEIFEALVRFAARCWPQEFEDAPAA